MRFVRRYDPDERDSDGAVHLEFYRVHNCGKHLRSADGEEFSGMDWLEHIYEGSNKMRFQYCMNSKNVLFYIRVIQGHTGGNMIASELIGHVRIPYNWKEFLFHRGVLVMSLQSSYQESSLEDEKAKKEDRSSSSHTLNPFGDNPDGEEFSDDVSKSGKVLYHRKWKNTQDAVYWINLARAQDKGLRFWKTRSHAVIVYSSVLAGCIHKVISQIQRNELYSRDSRRLVPHRRLYLKGAWQPQQQQQDTSESASCSTRKLVQRVHRKEQGNPTDDPELPSARKLERSTESLVEKEEPEF